MTCSTVTGIVLGGVAYHLGLPLPTCLLGGGLCSMAGMLPDIDSDTSRSFQECIYLAAGLCAVLWVHRLLQFNLSQDMIILNGAGMFLFVRFVVGEFIKKMTAHRGMFHSIPAALLTGEIVFFLSAGSTEERTFKAFAITAGYFSHLILDECCSIDASGKTLRLKKSFGTALKFIDTKRMPVTLCLYSLIVFIGLTAVNKPELVAQFETADDDLVAADKTPKEESPPGQKILHFLTSLEGEKVSAVDERKVAMQREVVEYLVQREQAPQIEQASTVPVSTLTRPSSRRRRYAEQQVFSQNRPSQPAAVQMPVQAVPSAQNSLQPLHQNQVNATSTSYQMTTLRGNESVPGIPQESTGFGQQSVQPSQYTPVYSPPQFSAQPLPSIQNQAEASPSNAATPPATAVPMGIVGHDFAPKDRNFSLPKRQPAPLFLP